MNDLMTRSFLNYVDLKKQAQIDTEEELFDIEVGQTNSPKEEENLSHFFNRVSAINSEMEEITNLLHDLQNLNEETKSCHNNKILRGLRDRMESNTLAVLRKVKSVKTMLESLDKSNLVNRKVYKEGSPVDRTRISVTNGVRTKLREMMNGFQLLRENIMYAQKQDLKRNYYIATGKEPSEEVIDRMMSGNRNSVQIFENKTDFDFTRHKAVMEVQRSLTKLHQVFLDMAVIVEKQGEKMNDIEENLAKGGNFICGGTNSLFYAKQMKKKKDKTLVYLVMALVFIVLLVCFVSILSS
ncbi:hypothetical protein ACFE04_024087 [Oxalis oulophora]